MDSIPEPKDKRLERAIQSNRRMYSWSGRWLMFLNIGLGILIGLPWLAPLFMKIGWEQPAMIIHFIYRGLCHQYPQRSYFLFGEQVMYSLEEIALVWPDIQNPLEIRKFVGNPEMGYKVAWSDRMISMYGGMFLGGLIYGMVRKWIPPISFWLFLLFCVPMGIDGLSHTISDIYGLGNGFRYTNLWLAELTNFRFATDFYVGNAFWSFNWWMRLWTGLIFGIGLIWWAFPQFEASFQQTRYQIEAKFNHAGIEL